MDTLPDFDFLLGPEIDTIMMEFNDSLAEGYLSPIEPPPIHIDTDRPNIADSYNNFSEIKDSITDYTKKFVS